ncbi:MAG: hypothetical protein GX862_07380 [Leucobacter sp.]|nr:hypothetical protein [Leucobacter sp.]
MSINPVSRLRRSHPAEGETTHEGRHLQAVDTAEATHPPSHVPDPSSRFIRALAAQAFEAVEGTRSISQLGGSITFSAARLLAIQRQALSERRAIYGDQRSCAPSPGPLHLCRLPPRFAEASVAIHTGLRTYAVALRLEWSHSRWRATEIFVL